MTETSTDIQPEPNDSIGALSQVVSGDPMAALDTDMKHVLDTMRDLGARPLEYSSPNGARRQPQPSDAVEAIYRRQRRGLADDGVEAEDIAIGTGDEALAARLYRPVGLLSRLNPMVLYFHGGGFVTGDLDSHDDSARALARRSGAIVLSVAYRLAPEHPFPAAHDDALTAWRFLLAQAHTLGGDPRRLAVAGEDAGANLAAHVALEARKAYGPNPVHQLLIHPIAGTDMTTPSYGEMLRAQPIGLPAMRWRFRQLANDTADLSDPRIDLAQRDDLSGTAPATILLAGIDPLRSEGEALAEAMENAGVPVNCWTYPGVTQGFFGLGLLVTKALFAQGDAADALGKAFTPSWRS